MLWMAGVEQKPRAAAAGFPAARMPMALNSDIWRVSWEKMSELPIGKFARVTRRGLSPGPLAVMSSVRVFMMNTRAQRKLLHTWIKLVIVEQYLEQIG